MATKRKKSAKKVVETILKDGLYFAALYEGKKIRGIVRNGDYLDRGRYYLDNSQHGEENCDSDFPFTIYIRGGISEALKEAGVTKFRILRDKRQIALVDGDTGAEVNGYRANYDGTVFSFGCGAVKLSLEEVEAFKQYASINRVIKNFEDVYGEISVAELEEYIANKKKAASNKYKTLYENVVDQCSDHISENSLLDTDESEIESLFDMKKNLAKKLA